MQHFEFSDLLSSTAHAYTRADVKPWLSFDGQVYLSCSSCGRVLWCNPLFIAGIDGRISTERCDNCQEQKLQLAKFQHQLTLLCSKCYTEAHFDSRSPVRCSRCNSTHYQIIQIDKMPEFPLTFGTAFETKPMDWCISVADDIKFLLGVIRSFRAGAGFHATCLHMVDFFKSLYERGEYQADNHARSELINAPAMMLRQVFRETGDIKIGIQSIELMKRATELVTSDLDIALYSHNVAAFIYSLLAKRKEAVANAMAGQDIRSEALSYARKALRLYLDSGQLDDKTTEIKCAEVEWLIGDIIGADDPGDEALREALAWYDNALLRDGLPSHLQGDIHMSRTQKIGKMRVPHVDESHQAEVALETHEESDSKYDILQTIQELDVMAEDAFSRGDTEEGINILCKSYGHVRVELSSSSRDVILRNYGSSILRTVVSLAKSIEDLGSPRSALAVLEDFRAFAIWEKESHAEISRRSAKIALAHKLAELLGNNEITAFDDQAMEEAVVSLDESLQTLFDHDCNLNSILLLELEVRKNRPYILSCRRGAECFEITGHVTTTPILEIDALVRPMLTLALNNFPNRVRAARVRKLLGVAASCFGDLVREISNDPTEPITLISSLGMIPFEALAHLANPALPPKPIRYAPSIRIAGSMAKSWANRQIERVLTIGYKGTDLPAVELEIRMLQDLFGGSIRTLTGRDLSRTGILNALQAQHFDIVHFACHGIFDPADPLASAMLLSNQSLDEEDRLSAKDLLGLKSLNSSPLVVLSACSSAVISTNGSNNFLGLTGALLRLGVSGIVGSRWPVGDNFAISFMKSFYKEILDGIPPVNSLANAQADLMRDHRIDEWTSFMYIGT